MSVTNIDRIRNHYTEEFDELVEVWKTADNKAQGTAAVAGILIAGSSLLVRVGAESGSRVFFVITFVEMLILVLAIILSIGTLLVRRTPLPLSGEQADLIWRGEAPEILKIGTEIDLYGIKNSRLHELIIKKGWMLMAAQCCVLIGAIVILPLILFLFCSVVAKQ